MIRAALTIGMLLTASAAWAQSQQPVVSEGGGTRTMSSLLSDGYEIKASVPNGTKFIVFMQKDKSAYACEFTTVKNSQCRSIN